MTLLFLFLSVLIASFVGTITGFGTSTILVPLFLLFFPFPEVLLFVAMVHWLNNIWKMFFFRSGKSFVLLGSFGLMAAVGSFLGARIVLSIDHAMFQGILGLFLILYAVFAHWKPKAKLKITPFNSYFGGLVSGVASGVFGIGGTVQSMFLNAFGLKKATYLFTVGAICLIIDSTRILTYWQQGFTLSALRLEWLLLTTPTSLFGVWLAKKCVDRIPEHLFRKVVLTALACFGVYFIIKTLL